MARLTEKDWRKLRSQNKFKGTMPRPIPRWVTSRKGRAEAKAWDKKLKDVPQHEQ